MSWKWIVIGAALLGASLSVLVLSPIWIASMLLFRSGTSPTAATERSTPAVPDPSMLGVEPGPGLVEPRLSSPSGSPPPTRPTKRGMSRATRAAVINELGAAIGALQSRLEQCPDQPTHRGQESARQQKLIEFVTRQLTGAGGSEALPPEIASANDRELPTIMMVEVETFDSQAKIVDAALAMAGSATDAFVACARQVLRGQILFAPATLPGEHLQIPVDLSRAGTASPIEPYRTRRHR
jgi:hypothetical protein